MFSYLLQRLFGSAQQRRFLSYQQLVDPINKQAERFHEMPDASWKDHLHAFKNKAYKFYEQNNALSNDILIEAYAFAKSACMKLCNKEFMLMGNMNKWNMIPYDVQIVSAISMFNGDIAEMETGEGKTLTAIFPLFLYSLTKKPVFLVTINEYLAQRDKEWMSPVYHLLGCTVGFVKNSLSISEKQSAYAADITYITASELGFDFLRDHSIAVRKDLLAQRGMYFALIDEVDHVLINEAKTPLIISGPADEAPKYFQELKPFVEDIVQKQKHICTEKINFAKKILDNHQLFDDRTFRQILPTLPEIEEAGRAIWLVSRGWPEHDELKSILEFSHIRTLLDKYDIFFSSDQNKDEMKLEIAQLYMIQNFNTKDFELTETGQLKRG